MTPDTSTLTDNESFKRKIVAHVPALGHHFFLRGVRAKAVHRLPEQGTANPMERRHLLHLPPRGIGIILGDGTMLQQHCR